MVTTTEMIAKRSTAIKDTKEALARADAASKDSLVAHRDAGAGLAEMRATYGKRERKIFFAAAKEQFGLGERQVYNLLKLHKEWGKVQAAHEWKISQGRPLTPEDFYIDRVFVVVKEHEVALGKAPASGAPTQKRKPLPAVVMVKKEKVTIAQYLFAVEGVVRAAGLSLPVRSPEVDQALAMVVADMREVAEAEAKASGGAVAGPADDYFTGIHPDPKADDAAEPKRNPIRPRRTVSRTDAVAIQRSARGARQALKPPVSKPKAKRRSVGVKAKKGTALRAAGR